MRPRTAFLPTAATAATAGIYLRYVRPWQLTWGATPEDVARALPSDHFVPHPTFNATRAISIDAPPAKVWPWLVQAGVTRAGWYSYDLLDNLGHPSARRILASCSSSPWVTSCRTCARAATPMTADG